MIIDQAQVNNQLLEDYTQKLLGWINIYQQREKQYEEDLLRRRETINANWDPQPQQSALIDANRHPVLTDRSGQVIS